MLNFSCRKENVGFRNAKFGSFRNAKFGKSLEEQRFGVAFFFVYS